MLGLIFFLRDFPATQVKQGIDGGLAVPRDAAQFSPLPIASTENVSKWNNCTSQFRTDGPAEKLVLVEDSEFGQVTGVEA